MKQCHAEGCAFATRGYSKYCGAHSNALRRHGHPTAQPIRKRTVQQRAKQLRAWVRSRANADAIIKAARERATELHRAQADYAQAALTAGYCITHKRAAAEDISDILSKIDTDDAIFTVAAVTHLRMTDPTSFPNDRFWFFCLARQFRALTEANYRWHINPKTQKAHRVQIEPTPRKLEYLGQQLAHHLGALGAFIFQKQEEEKQKALTNKTVLFDVISQSHSQDAIR